MELRFAATEKGSDATMIAISSSEWDGWGSHYSYDPPDPQETFGEDEEDDDGWYDGNPPDDYWDEEDE